jgi:hypothetical protein
MTFDWQTVAVLVVVATACAYLGRTVYATLARRKAGACGGCGTCTAQSSAAEPEVVALASSAKACDAVPSAVHATNQGSGSN